jgi:putative ABC transport system ATP-binding protein
MIKLQQVCKSFLHGSERIKILHEINLEIKKHEFVAIIGPSGSGKSTLLHLIGGLEQADQGEISVADINLAKLSQSKLAQFRADNVGFVFQSFHLHSALTVEENILLPTIFYNHQSSISKLLKQLNLDHRADHLPSELSGGERQRTAIGRALINNPKIILADEPTGNLDQETGYKIIKLLTEIHKKNNTTMVIVTHDEKIAAQADRIIEIQNGKIKN